MTELIKSFTKIAKFLWHPLVLIGFLGMLLFYIHGKLIDSGLLKTISSAQSSLVLQLLLSYGFKLCVLVTVLGFALQFYKTHHEVKKKTSIKKKIQM
ncbi:MAG: hypothetical protein WAX77_15540 [Methylococcaceae bacterium]